MFGFSVAINITVIRILVIVITRRGLCKQRPDFLAARNRCSRLKTIQIYPPRIVKACCSSTGHRATGASKPWAVVRATCNLGPGGSLSVGTRTPWPGCIQSQREFPSKNEKMSSNIIRALSYGYLFHRIFPTVKELPISLVLSKTISFSG